MVRCEQLEGFDYANERATLRLAVGSDQVTVGTAATRAFEGQLVLWRDGTEAAHWPVVLQPGWGVVQTWFKAGANGAQWELPLLDQAGQIVAAWGRRSD